MLSKCANAECANLFRYLHEGKLFRLEIDGRARSPVNAEPDFNARKSNRHLEFFWLCDSCSARMTLTYHSGFGVSTRLLGGEKKKAPKAA